MALLSHVCRVTHRLLLLSVSHYLCIHNFVMRMVPLLFVHRLLLVQVSLCDGKMGNSSGQCLVCFWKQLPDEKCDDLMNFRYCSCPPMMWAATTEIFVLKPVSSEMCVNIAALPSGHMHARHL